MKIFRLPRQLTRSWKLLGSLPRAEARFVLVATLLLFLVLVTTSAALAGPGGQFAKAIAKTWPGKIALGVLFLILLPLGLYVMTREALEVRKTRRDLAELAKTRDYFDWASIEARIEEAAAVIGEAWSSGDLEEVADYMTRDYHESQQALLDRWRLEGKQNVYTFHDINKIKPLYVRVGGNWWRDQVLSLIHI